jgi:hypothetical protein
LPIAKPVLLILHGLLLGTLPAKGPCELVLSTSKYNNIPKHTDTEVGLLFDTETSDKMEIVFATVIRSDVGEKLLFTFNVTNTIEWNPDETKINIMAKKKDYLDGGEWNVIKMF